MVKVEYTCGIIWPKHPLSLTFQKHLQLPANQIYTIYYTTWGHPSTQWCFNLMLSSFKMLNLPQYWRYSLMSDHQYQHLTCQNLNSLCLKNSIQQICVFRVSLWPFSEFLLSRSVEDRRKYYRTSSFVPLEDVPAWTPTAGRVAGLT